MLLQRGCTWLTLMPLLLSLSTGELSFYRDALPKTSEDVALKHIARYLEAQREAQREALRLQQRLHRSHLSMFLSPMHKKHNGLQLDKQAREILKILNDKLREGEAYQEKDKTWAVHRHRPMYDDPMLQIAEQEAGSYLLPYYHLGTDHLGYPEEKQPSEKDDRFTKGLGFDVDRDVMEKSRVVMLPMHSFYGKHNHETDVLHHEGGSEAAPMQPAATEPEFTYKFDNSNLEDKHPFAVKPNDPRYYSNTPFSSDDFDRQANWHDVKATNQKQMLINHEDDMRSVNQKTVKDLTAGFDIASETERSAGHYPLIMPVNHDLNNDIYFIAIVAGCSAAAMFALVLISLTWCRLQRGAKAAADIEYPAYGVTGPNKDISPSGDQRLAQSAQMYHFQHQKQQIIAMENRTSATRDPGSLSEAESDEENEEGDYTVYECPGLASRIPCVKDGRDGGEEPDVP
ncbi:uncharacterized protein LOC105274586 isoform X2 [Ooceraea biroi]|uniref:uncharacterized protein LOC105274586 isoform X2 n=1 Tax=Ooceraea biroi TaxID=2015173 RepID=UPI0005B80986|nr:uncharacterized protein LOC105274586 isoform X2 [Ooceraea biroi]